MYRLAWPAKTWIQLAHVVAIFRITGATGTTKCYLIEVDFAIPDFDSAHVELSSPPFWQNKIRSYIWLFKWKSKGLYLLRSGSSFGVKTFTNRSLRMFPFGSGSRCSGKLIPSWTPSHSTTSSVVANPAIRATPSTIVPVPPSAILAVMALRTSCFTCPWHASISPYLDLYLYTCIYIFILLMKQKYVFIRENKLKSSTPEV